MGLPRDAVYIVDWSPLGDWSYSEFLKRKQLERLEGSVQFAIDNQTKRLIASNEQLLKRGFKTIDKSLMGGFSRVSSDIKNLEQSVRDGTAEIASVLRWGFTALAISIRQMNDRLDEIIRILKNPRRTEACELFEDARNHFYRGRYPEALDRVTEAIDVWNTEFRFYYLLGRVRIGSWIGRYPNTSPKIVDPKSAEDAFLKAARYHEAVSAEDSGRIQALLFAARAAFFQRELESAVAHAEDALKEIPEKLRALRAAARFQHAKYLCAEGKRLDNAKASLLGAFEDEITNVIYAAGDPDIQNRRIVLDAALSTLTSHLRTQYSEVASPFDLKIKKIKEFSFKGVPAASLLRDELSELIKARDSIAAEAAHGGPLDYDSAAKMAQKAAPRFRSLFQTFKSRFAELQRNEWKKLSVTRDAEKARVFLGQSDSTILGLLGASTGRSGWRLGWGLFFLLGAVWWGYSLYYAVQELQGHVNPDNMSGPLFVEVFYVIMALWLLAPFIRTLVRNISGVIAWPVLVNARAMAARKEALAEEAWKPFQNSIDALGREPEAF